MNIPKGWHEVTIKQFLSAHSIAVSTVITDSIEKMLHTIAIMAGITYKELESVKLKDIYHYNEQLGFLSELPEERLPLEFTIDGKKYKAMIFQHDMTAAQFIDYCSVCKDSGEELLYSMHKLLACFCVPKGEKYNGYIDTAEIFYNKMPVTMAYPFFVFFCKVAENLLPVMEDYFRKQTLTNLKKAKEILKKAQLN